MVASRTGTGLAGRLFGCSFFPRGGAGGVCGSGGEAVEVEGGVCVRGDLG